MSATVCPDAGEHDRLPAWRRSLLGVSELGPGGSALQEICLRRDRQPITTGIVDWHAPLAAEYFDGTTVVTRILERALA